MKAAILQQPGEPFDIQTIPIPTPSPQEVLIKVKASSICHGDAVAKYGVFPGMTYPLTAGHEVVGVIESVGDNVSEKWKIGDRVGTGWYGGHCFKCDACRDGDFVMCEESVVHGSYKHGGFAEYMVIRQEGLARIPQGLSDEEAAPLLCAGLTVFNALRLHPGPAGSVCAIQGIGGLGHLAVQYAAALGYQVVAISRGKEKEEETLKLGASVYIDAETEDAVEVLKNLGGASTVICTAPNQQIIADISAGVRRNGQVLVVAAPHGPVPFNAGPLIMNRVSVHFCTSGTAKDAEDTLNFSAQHNIKPKLEIFQLEDIETAFTSMMESKVKFRGCIKFE
eukprot:TRINITY_DN7147_c0_g1_i1.p1 TRINITY_DN7147_c0_g1~~TRINITY_DN7147_c0_g1_i1.p1  ORF type:complete len:337 (+),score=76.11 TRINITY_DN7147_c0_g1_i1:28-1038(+)